MPLRFTKEHEWIRIEGDRGVVGITDFAQKALGDVVFVELPPLGAQIAKGVQAAVVESVKAASEVYAPASGEVVAVNEALAEDPAQVNADPLGAGWFFKIRIEHPEEIEPLLDQAAYDPIRRGLGIMRYLPLTEADRRGHAGHHRRRFGGGPVRRRAGGRAASTGCSICRRIRTRWRWSGRSAGSPPAMSARPAFRSFLGAGIYRHHIPASVDHLIQRGEFLTSYTPYQPEVAQGTLQYLFEFQTQVALLTGMEIANASMYDGATACAEALMMASRLTRRRRAILSGGLHPHYRDVDRHLWPLPEPRHRRAAAVVAGTREFGLLRHHSGYRLRRRPESRPVRPRP